MESESFRLLVRPQEIVHRIIWMAFVGAVLMYVFVVYMLLGRAASGGGSVQSNPLTIPFVILSVLGAVLGPFMPRVMLPDSRLRQLLNRPSDQQATAGISADEQRLLALLPNFYTGFIVRLAFNESIALYGFMLALFSKSAIVILPFAIVSVALNLMVPLPLDSMRQRTSSLGLQEGVMPTRPQ
jgi:F0F1-type ATP synthase membrane subunit c/vacuolar-type H+-ATPase subunit K